MGWIAYYGSPSDHIWGRCEWGSRESAVMDCWNHDNYYGLHDTDKEYTRHDRIWDGLEGANANRAHGGKERQMSLFDGMARAEGRE